jgi:hypothetical protein
VVFYVIVFSGAAVLLVVGGLMLNARNRKQLAAEDRHSAGRPDTAQRRKRAHERAQSRSARRKRH